MTFATAGVQNLVDTGSGKLAMRVTIQGCPLQPCSDLGMEKTTSDGRSRVYCMNLDECGFVIDEQVNIIEAELEGKASNLRLFETIDEQLSQVFDLEPTVQTWLSTSIDASTTTIPLYAVTDISVDDVIHIGTEAMLVTAVGTASVTVTRGYWDTTAQAHYTSDIAGLPDLLVTNAPVRFRGRLVWVHFYGDGDTLTGDGSQVWVGQVRDEPLLTGSGTEYNLVLAHIVDLFKSKIGGEEAQTIRPSGIYYPASAGLRISISEYAPTLTYVSDVFCGRFETQVEFVEAFYDWLTTPGESTIADASLDSSYTPVVTDDGRWTMVVTVGSSTTSVGVHIESEQDGETSDRAELMRYESGEPVLGSTLSSGDHLYVDWRRYVDGARTVPRGFFRDATNTRCAKASLAATYPPNRVYTDAAVQSEWVNVTLEWPDNAATWARTGWPEEFYELDLPSGSDYLRIHDRRGTEAPSGQGYNAAAPVYMRVGGIYTRGDLADFRSWLLTYSASYAGRGLVPVVTEDALASWTAVVNAAAIFYWQKQREHTLVTSESLFDYIAHECRLLQVYPITNSAGQIALKLIDTPARTASKDIDEEIAMVDERPIELSDMINSNQTVSRVSAKIYSDHDPYVVQNNAAFILDLEDRPLDIDPKSKLDGWYDGDQAEQVAAAFTPVLSFFGYPHTYINVKVPWTCFGLRLGDTVTFSADHLPSRVTGLRPITSAYAIVTGRHWPVDEVYGELRLLMTWQNVAGYAPTARVSSTALVSGTTYDLTIDTSMYFDSGDDCTDHFIATDEVRIYNIDEESATVYTGTVSSVSATVLRVAFDSAPTFGSDVWEVIFDTYSNTTSSQKSEYAFMAGTDGKLGTSDPARTLAP